MYFDYSWHNFEQISSMLYSRDCLIQPRQVFEAFMYAVDNRLGTELLIQHTAMQSNDSQLRPLNVCPEHTKLTSSWQVIQYLCFKTDVFVS